MIYYRCDKDMQRLQDVIISGLGDLTSEAASWVRGRRHVLSQVHFFKVQLVPTLLCAVVHQNLVSTRLSRHTTMAERKVLT